MDSLCLKAGIQGISPPAAGVAAGLESRTTLPSHVGPSAVRRASTPLSVDEPSSSHWHSLKSLWPRTRCDAVSVDGSVSVDEEEVARDARPSGNWAARFLRLGSPRTEKDEAKPDAGFGEPDAEFQCGSGFTDEEDRDVCPVDDEDDADVGFNRDSFSKLLRRVSLRDARLYARMANLGNLAYSVAQIKPENLLRGHGLRFITSSTKKKQLAKEAENVREVAKEDKLKKGNDVAIVG
ncbi:unnamed protein product [Cuscuta campestris]|uniref:Uncharacterized protein n=1 Tax=Cuscuta campestris TaxID=132261 RepID=A0A484KZX9_9ASTE|nr:unnamed protein product [Cuscuta campestris]